MVMRKTNNGIPIDMDQIMASQKSTVATGNMNINANGDVLGKDGQIIQKNEDRVRAYYRDHPNSSTSTTSIRGGVVERTIPVDNMGLEPKTSKTLRENERVRKLNEPISGRKLAADNGYRERTDDNGDIEVISYTDEPENVKPKTKKSRKKKTDEKTNSS